MKVTIWHRQGLLDLPPGTYQVPADLIDQHFRGYQPGDPITAIYAYEDPTGPNVATHHAHQIAEQAFRMFNDAPADAWEQDHTRRYYAAGNRSLSVGDLVGHRRDRHVLRTHRLGVRHPSDAGEELSAMTTIMLQPPLHIGARLTPAVRVGDTSTIHISPTRRDPDGRVVWRYIIEDHDRHVLDDATDLRSGTGDEIDPNKAMATLLGFLTAAAEAYRHTMHGHHSENADLFPPDVTEWAYEHDDELAALALELTEPDTPEPDTPEPATGDATPAERDALWHQVWARTGCADCAGAAVEGRPRGPDHCWATHRPHTPIAETNDEGEER